MRFKRKKKKLKQINDFYNSLSRDINRATYTRRILEIVKNVKKQKIDIDKILIETRTLKKEKSTLIDTLQRAFAVTSETVFKDASEKKDPVAKQAYRDIVGLNDKFKLLAETEEEKANAKNTALDLDVKIEKIGLRTENLDVGRLEADLKRIKAENLSLIAKIKKASTKDG